MADLPEFAHRLAEWIALQPEVSEPDSIEVLHGIDHSAQLIKFGLGDTPVQMLMAATETADEKALTTADIHRMREEGALEALLDDAPAYILFAYEVYPNGTTAPLHEQDPEMGRRIGAKMGIGDPTDPMGWSIWDVGPVA